MKRIHNCARLAPLLGAALILSGASFAAQAQDAANAPERGAIVIGAFITDRRTSTRLDSDSGEGTDIDLEDDLGLESSTTVARLGGYFWIKPRHRLDFAYFDLSRDSTKQINETIEFGDETFVVDTIVSSTNDLSILKASYTFAPISRERAFLGISAGIYAATTELSISETTLGQFKSEDITAPLPVIGIRGDYAISDSWTLRGAVELFGYESGDVDGNLRDTYVGIDYSFGRKIALGLAYNDVSMSLAARESNGFEGRLDWGYDGFLVYLKGNFGSR